MSHEYNNEDIVNETSELLLCDHRGIYIPQDFTRGFDRKEWNVHSRKYNDSWSRLEHGPDDDLYWESWDEILSEAFHVDEDGAIWTLYQDGDLFAVCEPSGDESDNDCEPNGDESDND